MQLLRGPVILTHLPCLDRANLGITPVLSDSNGLHNPTRGCIASTSKDISFRKPQFETIVVLWSLSKYIMIGIDFEC
jgi:hypothetical protein